VQLLGKRLELHIFRHKDVQLLHAVTKILPSGSSTRKLSRRKKRVQSMCERSEYGSFSLLFFATSGGMGPTANMVYKRIASMIAQNMTRVTARPSTGSDAN